MPHTKVQRTLFKRAKHEAGLPKTETAEHQLEEKEKFDNVLQASNLILYQCKSIFPFELFTDTLTIYQTKIEVSLGLFFYSKQRLSIPVSTIIGVTGTNDLFFGSVMVETTGFVEPNITVKKLWKQDALKARRIIAGVLACEKQGIDLSQIDPKYVLSKIEEMGATHIG